jgi:hypothetical protein
VSVRGKEKSALKLRFVVTALTLVLFAIIVSFLAMKPVTYTVNGSGSLTILSVVPCNVSGNPKYSFELGEIVNFKVTIACSGSGMTNVLLCANIYDLSDAPQGVAWSNVTVSSGNSFFILSMTIPKSAEVGNAAVYVGAYTDWPQNSGFPLCPEVSAVFQIVPRALLGDVTGPIPNVPDGKVNMMDIAAVISKLGTMPSSPNWNPNMDLNKDGAVNLRDLYIVLSNITR